MTASFKEKISTIKKKEEKSYIFLSRSYIWNSSRKLLVSPALLQKILNQA